MSMRTTLTISSLPPLLAAGFLPSGAVPMWARLGLLAIGLVLLVASFAPKTD